MSRTDWIFCSALTNTETQLLYCHRLGTPPLYSAPTSSSLLARLPSLSSLPNIPAAHYFTEFIGHLYHHMACGAGGYRHRRHDAL